MITIRLPPELYTKPCCKRRNDIANFKLAKKWIRRLCREWGKCTQNPRRPVCFFVLQCACVTIRHSTPFFHSVTQQTVMNFMKPDSFLIILSFYETLARSCYFFFFYFVSRPDAGQTSGFSTGKWRLENFEGRKRRAKEESFTQSRVRFAFLAFKSKMFGAQFSWKIGKYY